jgi:hypothetical protein
MKAIKIASELTQWTNEVPVSYIYTYKGIRPAFIQGMSSYVLSLASQEGHSVEHGLMLTTRSKNLVVWALTEQRGWTWAVAGTISVDTKDGEVVIPVVVKTTADKLQDISTLCASAVAGLLANCLPPTTTWHPRTKITKHISQKDSYLLDNRMCVYINGSGRHCNLSTKA